MIRLVNVNLVENKEELQKIVAGCVKGKARYQKKLFEMFYGKMMGVCMRYSRDQDQAQDIVQTGFIKIFKKIEVYNFKGSLEGWIRRIMVNTAIDHIRKNKRDPFSIEDDARIEDVEGEDFFAYEKEEETKIKADVAMKAISKLSPAYRTVFNMYVIEGFTHKEIAEYLGVSEGTSKSNLAKAKQKLREELSLKFEH